MYYTPKINYFQYIEYKIMPIVYNCFYLAALEGFEQKSAEWMVPVVDVYTS